MLINPIQQIAYNIGKKWAAELKSQGVAYRAIFPAAERYGYTPECDDFIWFVRGALKGFELS